MPQIQKDSNKFENSLFFIVSALLLLGLPSSEWMITAASGLLFLQVFITLQYRRLFQKAMDLKVWMYPAVFLVYLGFLLMCNDPETGNYELRKNVFWLAIPFSVALSPKIKPIQYRWLLMIFIIGVTISTFITFTKILFSNYFHIIDVRFASYVSHFTFSLLVIFAFYILIIGKIKQWSVFRKIPYWAVALWSIWLIVFLGFQKSLIGVISLLGSAVVFLFWLGNHALKGRYVKIFRLGIVLLIMAPIVYVAVAVYKFYDVPEFNESLKLEKTASGNSYSFNLKDKQKENGNYVYWYINKKEVKAAWAERSSLDLTKRDYSGYRVYVTLVRYLTSKGLKKDAEGVAALTDEDIANIESGIANYIYVDYRFILYPKVYQTIWELDEYFRTGNANNKSLSQRIEYSKAALYLIKKNFWGIGTGNYKQEFHKAYEEMGTQLDECFWFHVHNQYLSYTVKFGILGVVLILFLIIYPVVKKKGFKRIILVLLFVIVGLANMGEALLETHIGLPFFTFFTSLIIWHSPEEDNPKKLF